jgi:NNP family nitrate/nitrite transporter-like MFS transporter
MNLRRFLGAGHLPTLICAFLYFTVSCSTWMMIGALANSIIPDLGPLSDSQKGMMVAVPVLGGALLRLVVGPMSDHIGAKKTALFGLALTLVPLMMGWLWTVSYLQVLLVGLLLGVAGASFAAALPMASRWYPPQYQGLVLGIAGAGNVGTACATFYGPWAASFWGWHAAFAIAIVPVLATVAVVALVAKDSPTHPAPKTIADYAAVLKLADTGWFCFFYAITFGGFMGLLSYLALFFRDHYALTNVQAGTFATVCALTGSMIRPLGGYLSDRYGGIRVLTWLYLGVAATMASVSALPPLGPATLLLATGMTLLGMGNGAVFQLVAQRFPGEIGVVTGLVGAAGGVGGFVLANVLGSLSQLTASHGGGFMAFALVSAVGAGALSIFRSLDHSFSIFIPAAVDARPGRLRGHRGRLQFEYLRPARHDHVGANGQACEPQGDVVMTELR